MLEAFDWSIVLVGVAVVVLIALSGFFSGSETALTAASRGRMHNLEQEGSSRAGLVNRLRDNKDALIGALLLGNNMVNVLATALSTSLLLSLFGEAGVAYATIAMTALIVIFAEVMPKTYAIHNSDKMSLAVAPVIHWLTIAFRPAIWLVTTITRGILRAFGTRPDEASGFTHEDELRGAIELHGTEHTAGDEESRHERAMLRSILDLGDVEVSEIMTHRRNITAIDVDLPQDRLIEQVLESPYTRLPLWQGEPDNIVGVLHAKALLRAVRAAGGSLEDLHPLDVAAAPWFIPDTTSLLDQLQAFRNRREHFALVVDEYGSLQGIVTLEDILEEIVGEIDDEHDLPVAGVRPQPNGSYIVDGTVTIRDLNRRFEWRLPDGKASTVAGLVLHEARRLPQPGQIFIFHGFRFEILRRQRNQITSLRLTPPAEDTPTAQSA